MNGFFRAGQIAGRSSPRLGLCWIADESYCQKTRINPTSPQDEELKSRDKISK